MNKKKNTIEYIACAAYRLKEGVLCPHTQTLIKEAKEGEKTVLDIYAEPHNEVMYTVQGWRHADIIWRFGDIIDHRHDSGGFMTSKGRYVDRIEGMKIAFLAGQIPMENAILEIDMSSDVYDITNLKNEDDFTYSDRKKIAEDVKKWFTLYSEDIY